MMPDQKEPMERYQRLSTMTKLRGAERLAPCEWLGEVMTAYFGSMAFQPELDVVEMTIPLSVQLPDVQTPRCYKKVHRHCERTSGAPAAPVDDVARKIADLDEPKLDAE